MSQEMKIVTILIAMGLICTLTEGKALRYRRGTSSLRDSYIVHFNGKGEPLSVAGFDDFVRALNGQRSNPALKQSSFAESLAFPGLQATPTTVSKLMTTTEPTISHQTRPLATGTLGTLDSIVAAKASLESVDVAASSTASPLKLPHEMSSTSPIAEPSVSTDKPKLTLALGHDDAAAMSPIPDGPSLSDVSNLVTPGENPPSKMTVSNPGFSHGTGLTSKVISLQPGVQTVLNYAQPPVAIQGYVPVAQTSYLNQALPTTYQKPYHHHHHHSSQPEIFDYASYPNQNLANDGNTPLQIVRQAPSLIDIGQGLGQGYRSAPQELPINLGGWDGIEYGGRRSIRLAKPVRRYSKFVYRVPVSSPGLRKIGFGPSSW